MRLLYTRLHSPVSRTGRPGTRANGGRSSCIQKAARTRGRAVPRCRRCASAPTCRPCTSYSNRCRGRADIRENSRSAVSHRSPAPPRRSPRVPAAAEQRQPWGRASPRPRRLRRAAVSRQSLQFRAEGQPWMAQPPRKPPRRHSLSKKASTKRETKIFSRSHTALPFYNTSIA